MCYKYLIFDLDGTLTDSSPGIFNALRYAFREMGEAVPADEALRLFVGPPLLEPLTALYGFSVEKAEEFVRIFRVYYDKKGVYENSPYTGVPEMLSGLAEAGFILAVATTKPERMAYRVTDHFDLTKYFSAIAGATSEHNSKADSIRLVFDRLGISGDKRGECLMIGDRRHDVRGAEECGIDCLGVRYGFSDGDELEKAGAKYITETVGETRRFFGA